MGKKREPWRCLPRLPSSEKNGIITFAGAEWKIIMLIEICSSIKFLSCGIAGTGWDTQRRQTIERKPGRELCDFVCVPYEPGPRLCLLFSQVSTFSTTSTSRSTLGFCDKLNKVRLLHDHFSLDELFQCLLEWWWGVSEGKQQKWELKLSCYHWMGFDAGRGELQDFSQH